MTAVAKKVKPHWTASLKRIGACSDAIAWAKGFKSAQAAWDACADPSWMMWAIGACDDSPAHSPSRRKIVGTACAFARLSLPNFEKQFPDDKRLHECLDLCERYAAGDEAITLEMLRRAAASAGRAAWRRAIWPTPPWSLSIAIAAAATNVCRAKPTRLSAPPWRLPNPRSPDDDGGRD